MGRKTYTAEQIINKLREAEVLLSQGSTVGEASRLWLLAKRQGHQVSYSSAEQ